MSRLIAGMALLFGCLASGCVEPGGTVCNNGRTCPAATACDEVHGDCVDPRQLETCVGVGDGIDCGIHGSDDGLCDQGICIVKRCGDGYRRGDEACDGNDIPMDADCKDLGFYEHGTPTCNDACGFDVDPATTVCAGYCGDETFTPGVEVCEADVSLNNTCLDFGFGTGGLECADCRPDTRDCIPFGWGLTYLGATVLDVHGTAPDDVWALLSDNFTYENAIAHFDGMTWSTLDLGACALVPIDDSLYDIWSPAKGVVFAEGGEAVIRVTPTSCERLPAPPDLTSSYFMLWASSTNDVWTATSIDQVWQYDGATWTLKLTLGAGEGYPLEIWGSGPNDVYLLLTSPASLAHYDGTGWQKGIDPGISNPNAIWGTSPTDIYVGNALTPEIAHYNGTSWSPFPSPPPQLAGVVHGDATADGKVYVSGYGSTPLVYDGVSWTNMGAPANGEIWAGPGGEVWMATGESGAIARFTGSGHVETLSTSFRRGLAIRTTTDAYTLTQVPGPSGDLQLEHWNGATWQVDTGAPSPSDVMFSPTGKLMAIGWHSLDEADRGLWIRAVNGAWSHAPNVTEGLAISVVADDNVWILGFGDIANSANVLHWTSTSSATPFPIAKPVGSPAPTFADIWAFSNTNIYVVGYSQDTSTGVNTPIILHSNGDPAAAWTSETLPALDDSLDRIWARSPTDIYVISHRGKLLHSSGDGTWALVDTPPGLKVYDVYGAPDDLFIATDNQLWRFDGVRWEPVSLEAPVAARHVAVVGSIIVALDSGGTLHRILRLTPW